MFVGANYSIDPTFSPQRISSGKTDGIMDFSEVTGAAAEESWEHGPLKSAFDIMHYHNPAGYPEGRQLSKEDIDAKKETEFYAKFIEVPEDGLSEREYNILYKDAQERKMRESVFSRAPDTFTQGAKNFGVMLAVGMVDPLNIVFGYMPSTVVKAGALGAANAKRIANYQQSLEAMSVAGRAGTRAGVGGAEAIIGGVPVEALVYAAANLRGEDYDAGDVFNSIMFGAAIGSGIHVAGGALYDVAMIPSKNRRRERESYKQALGDEIQGMVKKAYTNADDHSIIQRQLARLSKADRAALTQSNMSQFLSGTVINHRPMMAILESKRLGAKFRPEDAEAVRAEVIAEHLEAELDQKSASRVSYADTQAFKETANRLRNEVTDLETQVNGFVIKKGASKAKRARLEKLKQKLSNKKAELESVRAGNKLSKKNAKVVRDRVKAIREGTLPEDVRKSVDAEVARRMEIVDATHLPTTKPKQMPGTNKLNAAIRAGLGEMKEHVESPASQRTYRPNAEADAKQNGKRQSDTIAMTEVAQQAADAEVNAKALADDLGVEYQVGDLEVQTKQVEDSKTAMMTLGRCMGKTS